MSHCVIFYMASIECVVFKIFEMFFVPKFMYTFLFHWTLNLHSAIKILSVLQIILVHLLTQCLQHETILFNFHNLVCVTIL